MPCSEKIVAVDDDVFCCLVAKPTAAKWWTDGTHAWYKKALKLIFLVRSCTA
jgi:hypothetical protein